RLLRIRSSSRSTIRCRLTSTSSESTPMRTCTMFWRTCTRFDSGSAGPERAGLRQLRDATGRRGAVVGRAFQARLVFFVLALGVVVSAQDSWPTYHGDFTGQRHSKLTQITPANVHQLSLAWAFQTNQAQQIKASPIVVDGVVYIT